MNTKSSLSRRRASLFLLMGLIAAQGHAQFIAFNDHAPGAGTATNVTTWNLLGNSPGSSGALKDLDSGTALSATVTITRSGSISSGNVGANPNPGTPLYNTFNGYVDFAALTNGDASVQVPYSASVTYTFSGLNPAKIYSFKAGAVRGTAAYTNRWSLVAINGAASFTSAHSAGALTAGLATNQVALNTGLNLGGEMVDWENIVPGAGGTFSVTMTQFTNVPGGTLAPYGYALTGFRLQELVPTNMQPLVVTGFNWDVMVEKGATNGAPYTSYAAELNPGENRAFYQKGLPGKNYGLPLSGGFLSAVGDGTVFQFAPYTSSNALVLSSDTGVATGTLTLATPTTFARIAVVANSASGGGTSPMTLNFADGTTLTTTLAAPDWFNNTGYALQGVERINLSSGASDGATTNPRFYQTTVDLAALLGPANKPLRSITFNKVASANSTAIYALSGQPAGSLPPVFLLQPTNATVDEGRSATFSAAVAGSPFPALQWYRNGAVIPGATALNYTVARAALADNGARFQLVAANVVSNLTCSVTSGVVTLTVVADTTAPVLLGAQSLGLTQVRASFSEPLTPATATNLANYALSGLTIFNAALDASQSNVVLNVSAMTDGAAYTLVVDHLTDQSATANVIAADSTAAFAASRFMPAFIGTSAGGLSGATNGLNLWAGGVGLGGTNDSIQFGWVAQTGDFDCAVRLDALTLADAWSQAGLMAREDLSAGARFACALATPSISGAFFEARGATNGLAPRSGSFPVNYPNTWLRLKRAGSTFTGFAGLDGRNWTALGATNLNFPATIYFGFVVSSHNTNALASAAFREFAPVTVAGTNAPLALEPLGQCSRRTSLVLSEIMYHPTNSALQFVELFNTRGEPQKLGGWQLDGSIHYTFPADAVIPAGGFLVVAKSPADLQSAYAGTSALGPFSGKLPNSSGTVRLLNPAGGVMLEVNYSDSPPWPVAADGAGPSLVLARPSYGENNPLAWAASDAVGGSPGRLDPVPLDPLRDVCFNEWLAHTDPPQEDSLELYNRATTPRDISGCWLSDQEGALKYQISGGTVLSPRGFIAFGASTLGFELDKTGGKLFLVNPDGTRVLDAIRYEGQENGVSMGRVPDGGTACYRLAALTLGTNNGPQRLSAVVINELMYAPISLDDNDEYLELFNRSTNAVDLSGWQLLGGIDFTFPANTLLAAGGYLVVARDAAHLRAAYPQLTAANCLGDFNGKLSNQGERVALAYPHASFTTNGTTITTNVMYIVVNEVTYGAGGQWPVWAHKGGSSLELVDPNADNRLAPNWADSDETHKAPWTVISATGVLDNATYGTSADQLQLLLQGVGECLVDDVQVLDASSVNHIANSSFESGASGWTAEGTESQSGLETSEGYNSSQSYHLRAVENGDNQFNRVRCAVSPALAANTVATIQAKVRWLKGHPEVLLRLRGNWLECVGEMTLPVNPGTPGLPNSRLVAHAPPAITEVSHSPVLPQANEPITVSARVSGAATLATVQLKYRLDPATTYATLTMTNDGGWFRAAIPGQATGTLVAFVVTATDTLAATSTFPSDAPAREGLVRVGELQPTGNFPVYRLWMTQATLNQWLAENHMDNTPLNVTFALNNSRVIYGAQSLYDGSPYISPGYNGPTGKACGYKVHFPKDDVFLGSDSLVVDWAGGHGGETTALQEQMGYWIAEQLRLPFSHRYTVRLHVNGVTDEARKITFEACLKPDSEFLDQWSPNQTDGAFHKIERAFDLNDSGNLAADPQPRLQPYLTTGGAKKLARYRWNWPVRGGDRVNDYSSLFALVDAFSSAQPQPYTANVANLVDVEEWMRLFATEHIIVNFDAWGHEIGKNMYLFQPAGGRAQLFMYDLDWLMLAASLHISSYAPSTAPLFNAEDPTVTRFYAFPPFARAYWRAVQDAVNGPLAPQNCNPVIEAKSQSLFANGIQWCDSQALTEPSAVKTWFSQRRAGLQSQLATVASPFTLSQTVSVTNGLETITGTAPIGVAELRIDGVAVPVTWTTLTNWTATFPLRAGTNLVSIVGYDLTQQPVSGASTSVTTVYNLYTNPPSFFLPGNLAVLRLGDGVQTLSSRGNSAFIDQFTPRGTLVNSVAIADSGSNAFVVSGSASSEGALSRSADGRLLMMAGYQIALTNAASLSSSLANADAALAPRALGAVDASGAFALVGVTTNQFSGNNIRSGASDGRGHYWGAGATSGTFYFGDGTPATVQTNVVNSIALQDLGGNLYFSTQKITNGLWKISGAPTALASASPILRTGSSSAPYGFAFNPAFTTAYIADDTKNTGGIQRWDLNAGVWALTYAFRGLTNTGARGVAVDFSGAQPVVYATTAESSANRLVSLTDTGAVATVTTLATAGANQIFRGVALAPDTNSVPQIFGPATGPNGFHLTWTGLVGRDYTVEYCDDLAAGQWTTLTNMTLTAPTASATDVAPAPHRFYRVVLNPVLDNP